MLKEHRVIIIMLIVMELIDLFNALGFGLYFTSNIAINVTVNSVTLTGSTAADGANLFFGALIPAIIHYQYHDQCSCPTAYIHLAILRDTLKVKKS